MDKSFDLESVYDEKVSPLMAQIIDICKEHDLPFIAEFLYKNDEEDGEQLCTSAHLPDKQRGKSEHMEQLWQIVKPRRSSALTMTVTKADGSKEITTILG